MKIESFIFDPIPRGADTPSLKITAKRYTADASELNDKGLTLLFTHCIGAHKEQWEPIIEQLFESQAGKDPTFRVREAWSFDWQNHGDAAVVNREALKNQPEGVSAFEWSATIASFVKSSRMWGHRIVPIGHSAGAAAMVLTTRHIPKSSLPYSAMILVEPTMVTREVFDSEREERMSSMEFVVTMTATRRGSWRSREEAVAYFSKRIPWETWDPRVIQLLVEHGLESNPEGDVSLKCDPKQESMSYPDVEPHFEGALQIGEICRLLPVHLIWGTRNDLVPEFIQESLADISQGRRVASVTKVEDAGHMVVQEQPILLANVISTILDGLVVPIKPRL